MVSLREEYDLKTGKTIYSFNLNGQVYQSHSKQKLLSMIAKQGLIRAGRGALTYSTLILNDTANRHAKSAQVAKRSRKQNDAFLKHVTGL